MTRYIRILFPFLLATALSACVSASKYKELENEKLSLGDKVQSQDVQLQKLNSDLKSCGDTNSEQEAKIKALEMKLGIASEKHSKLSKSIDEMTQALKELEARKKEADKEVSEYQKLMNSLKSLIDTGEVSVRVIRGRMVVSLGTDILFPSGSASLSDKGVKAIKEVTKTLSSLDKREFQIEGHTDNVPVKKTGKFPSNWELGSARAIAVVNTMVTAGMEPSKISAASFAENAPIAANDSKEGQAANRRIDIVVVPDLSNLAATQAIQKFTDKK